MENTSKNQQTLKYIAIIALSAAIGAAGSGVSFWYGQKAGIKKMTETSGQSATPSQSGAISDAASPAADNNAVFAIAGKIKSIDNDIISLENIKLIAATDPGTGLENEIRKVTVGSDTKFSTNDAKKIGLTDLKVGDDIDVFAAEDIRIEQEFTATLVRREGSPAPITVNPASSKDIPATAGNTAQ